ncbi:MAG: metallophosphoesterase, partial [Candidatus Aenigmarchaeota archaeon]|nr:metallophosphoesterase [Candidatus Aenigmarchaeota archaeon]
NGYRAIYIRKIGAIVISDLQIGEELYLAEERGILVPQFQLKEMKEDIKKILKRKKPRKLIINGDLKHEFGEASRQEWREVVEFLDSCKKFVKKIILVRGNHDNYLIPIAKKLGLKVYDPFYLENGFLFLHGHKRVEFPKDFHTLIIGHEQPAIVFRRGIDRAKVQVILYGKTKSGKNLICLPAFSPLASGVEVNVLNKEELLSPILREEVEIDELIPIAVDKEIGALKFPKIKVLRELASF